MFKDYAVLITEDTLDLIQEKNDGVRPELTSTPTYFITTDDPNKHNLILASADFWKNFMLVEHLKTNAFTEVREIHP